MKKYLSFVWVACAAACAPLLSAENQIAKQPEVAAKQPDGKEAPVIDIGKVSEAFGHLVGKNLQHIGVKFDIAQVIKGLQDATDGKESPMSEVECIQALTAVQEKVFKEQATDNLKKAEIFLQDNAKEKGMVSLENGKVQYRIEKEGKGPAVEAHYSPLIRLSGKFLDGSPFNTSKEEERVYMEELIPGLRSGLIGMKEGEKRTLYIHPELAFGTSGYFPPNSLLSFEVELVEANGAAIEEDEVQTAGSDAKKGPSEVVDTETHVR
jgi:peptidylprolyl isomerase